MFPELNILSEFTYILAVFSMYWYNSDFLTLLSGTCIQATQNMA